MFEANTRLLLFTTSLHTPITPIVEPSSLRIKQRTCGLAAFNTARWRCDGKVGYLALSCVEGG